MKRRTNARARPSWFDKLTMKATNAGDFSQGLKAVDLYRVIRRRGRPSSIVRPHPAVARATAGRAATHPSPVARTPSEAGDDRATETQRRGAQLHGRDDAGDHHLPRLDRQRLGDP